MGTWRQAAEIERELGETRIKQSATALQASHEQMLHSQVCWVLRHTEPGTASRRLEPCSGYA